MNGCKVQGCGDNTIPASELKNGQVAVIVRNQFSSVYNGRIVTRHNYGGVDHLAQFALTGMFSSKTSDLTGDKCRVRVLKAGETLTIS